MKTPQDFLKPIVALFILTAISASCGKKSTDDPAAAATGPSCPTNYVLVPALSPYTTSAFCVAKYEMKITGQSNGDQTHSAAFIPESRADGSPWQNTSHGVEAPAECASLGSGYTLISNAQWQTIAQNIETVALNWSSGVVGTGSINQGYSPGAIVANLSADASDNNACLGTGETCTAATWSRQKRTHVLSNGSIIWDFAGNAWEPVLDQSTSNFGTDVQMSTVSNTTHTATGNVGSASGKAKYFFGTKNDHTGLGSPYGGFGIGFLSPTAGAVLRGGSVNDGTNSGIFAVNKYGSATDRSSVVGFRCVKTYQ